MSRKHIIVSGDVQGVGFRYYTVRTAQRFDVTGWVRNCPDGTVEIEAQGSERSLEPFVEAVRQGPAYSQVATVDVEPVSDVAGEGGFYVRR